MPIKPKYSLIIPCYNEEGNIEKLVQKCKKIFKKNIFEVIIVENGSTDNSLDILKKNLKGIENFKILKVKKNKGIGYGIVQGLKSSNGEIIGWTHGDLQTDPSDVKKAFDLAKSIHGDFLIKGKRLPKNRSALEIFFTLGFTFFESILFLKHFWEINAQPNVFTKQFFTKWKNPPLDYNIDLYCYYKALQNRVLIKRFDVEFKKRFSGKSKWNKNIFVRFIFILKTIIYSLKLRFMKNANN